MKDKTPLEEILEKAHGWTEDQALSALEAAYGIQMGKNKSVEERLAVIDSMAELQARRLSQDQPG